MITFEMANSRLRIGISRCLMGDLVRHDGGHKNAPALVAWLAVHAELFPICPEVEVGMGTPREPLHLQLSPTGVWSGAHRVRLVGVDSGTAWTSRMQDGRGLFAEALADALPGFPMVGEDDLDTPAAREAFLVAARAFRKRF